MSFTGVSRRARRRSDISWRARRVRSVISKEPLGVLVVEHQRLHQHLCQPALSIGEAQDPDELELRP